MVKETIRVLIVEDNPDLSFLMSESLKARGYESRRAASLREAREILSEERFDVVLLDLDLPDSKGASTVKDVYKGNEHIPFIAVTGRYTEELAAEVLASGAQDYLIKGKYEDDTLERVISYSIERKKTEVTNKAKSEYLANMSHEVRTPLNAIIGMAEILSETRLDDEQQQYLNTISSEADILLNMINEMLDLAKMEASRIELERIPFDLRIAIENIVDSVAYRAQQKGLAFNCYRTCTRRSPSPW